MSSDHAQQVVFREKSGGRVEREEPGAAADLVLDEAGGGRYLIQLIDSYSSDQIQLLLLFNLNFTSVILTVSKL